MPPDTLNYMILGYILTFAILAVIIASIVWRYRNLNADEAALDTLEKELGSSDLREKSASR